MNTPDLQTVAQRQWIEGGNESNLGYYEYEDVDFTTPLHAECEALVLRSDALARIEALERDAERWRCVRRCAASLGINGREWIWDQPNARERLDALIDAAIAQEQP